jgi:hypothetical protein
MTAIGPLESPGAARDLPQVQAVYEIMRSGKPGAMTAANLRMLLDALVEARVIVGAFELQILEWLAGFEPATCAVIVALLSRANHWAPEEQP